MTWLVVAAAMASVLPVTQLAGRPAVRQLAFRPLRRQRGRVSLVVCGVLIATAALTSRGVVGDGLRASIDHGIPSQLGPVDEEVLSPGLDGGQAAEAAIAASGVGGIQTLPLLVQPATVIGKDFVARLSPAQAIEVDFTRAAQFGSDPSATGISGPTPTGTTAVLGADLASVLLMKPGHRVEIRAYGQSRILRVARVLPRRGVAGLAAVGGEGGSASLNIFVAPGTIAAMRQQAGSASTPSTATSVVAVANGGPSTTVTAQLVRATRGIGAWVQPVKQELGDRAKADGAHFSDLFSAFGFFTAVGGLILLVLSFLALVEERRMTTGVLRAMGLRRGAVVSALIAEGWVYAVAGAVLGGVAGLGLARLVVVVARGTLAGPSGGRVDLVFSARLTSVGIGMLEALVAAVVILAALATLVARRSIAGAIRGAHRRIVASPTGIWSGYGWGLAAVAAAVTVVGAVSAQPVALIVGPVAAGVALIVLLSHRRRRGPVSAVAAAVGAWSLAAPTVFPAAFHRLDLGVVGSEGIALTMSGLALVVVHYRGIGERRPRRAATRRPALQLGLSYAQAEPARTATLVTMLATALFAVSLAVTIGQIEGHDVARVATQLGGGAGVLVTSDPTNPVAASDVAALDGVEHVASAPALPAQLVASPGGGDPPVTLVGVGADLIGHGTPALDRGSPAQAAVTFGLISRDPTKVVVGADFATAAVSGLSTIVPRIGTTIDLRSPTSGVMRTVTVAGLAAQARFNGTDHVYVSDALLSELTGRPPAASLLYVETAPSVNDRVLAAVIDGTHLANGTFARSFVTLAQERLHSEQQFLDILAGYASLALLADLTALTVVMVDRVRTRRRETATLRALGVSGRTITAAVGFEAVTIALQGFAIGVASCVLLAWRLTSGPALPELRFSAPWATLVVVGILTVLAAVAASALPARRAGRDHPGQALRYHE